MWSVVTKRVSVVPVIETGTRATEPEEDEEEVGHDVPEDDALDALDEDELEDDDDALDEDDDALDEDDDPPDEELVPDEVWLELEQAEATTPPAVTKNAISGAAERTRRRALRIVGTRLSTR